MQSRFDHVKYDEVARVQQDYFKHQMEAIEKALEQHRPSHIRDWAFKSLEECHMWIGKMIRDDQTRRNHYAKSKFKMAESDGCEMSETKD